MSSNNVCLALLLDGPMQSWGYASRFERRTTALHPTRSGIIGIIAAALGVDKHGPDEARILAGFRVIDVTTFTLPRLNHRSVPRFIQRLEDYHTVTGIRRASGKLDKEATVQTYRHYLLDARFGVILEGPAGLLNEISSALRNPRWGVWLGRKCCLPASPLLVGPPGPRSDVWPALLRRTGYTGAEMETQFDRVTEAVPGESGVEVIEDSPVVFGNPIGERHEPRWIRSLTKSVIPNPKA